MSGNNFQFNNDNLIAAQRLFYNPLRFKLMMFLKVPLNFLVGMRIKELNKKSCRVSVPYNWLTKNPFKSTFWAVLGMAAEMSCGALVVMYTNRLKPSVAIIIGDCSAEFVRKAKNVTTFVCDDGKQIGEAVKKAIETKEPQEVLCRSTGYSKEGDEVARFSFTWKMKARSD